MLGPYLIMRGDLMLSLVCRAVGRCSVPLLVRTSDGALVSTSCLSVVTFAAVLIFRSANVITLSPVLYVDFPIVSLYVNRRLHAPFDRFTYLSVVLCRFRCRVEHDLIYVLVYPSLSTLIYLCFLALMFTPVRLYFLLAPHVMIYRCECIFCVDISVACRLSVP